jgi:acylphosphatase
MKYLISGRVQGIGYRAFVRASAQKLKISGFVKNLVNGKVEVFAQGDENDLTLFLEILAQGPRMSEVHEIESLTLPSSSRVFTDFRIVC